ncbi:MAG: type II toxin-antitoxin system VapC family toxin [Ferruginibacter sp.]
MKYLLDTHILIWAILSPDKLSKKVTDILVDPENTILVSSLSLWEISLKYSSGKLQLKNILPDDFIKISQDTGFTFIDLSPQNAATFYLLSGEYHKDPFDRMLIWQALKNNLVFISDDKEVKKYITNGLKVIS